MILNHEMPLNEISSASESSHSDIEEQKSRENSISIKIENEENFSEENEDGIINAMTQRELIP